MDKLARTVAESLMVDPDQVTDSLTYNTIPEWDSVGHMVLVAAVEEQFDVMLNTDEIIAMSSVGVIRDILKKHGVDV